MQREVESLAISLSSVVNAKEETPADDDGAINRYRSERRESLSSGYTQYTEVAAGWLASW